MSRYALLRGSSACAIALFCASHWVVAPATAQQSLPAIDVGARRAASHPAARARTPAVSTAPAEVAGPPSGATGLRTAAQIWSPNLPDGRWAQIEKYQIPNPSVSFMTRRDIDKRVNILTSQDAIKYLPSLWVSETRGNTQGSMETRGFSNNSERNIVYLDGIPLNPLIGRGAAGTFFGGFQTMFKVISPEEIERVDFLTGPFSSQYDGRSMGGVLTYTSKMPDKFKFTVKETGALMDYNVDTLHRTFPRSLTELTLGDRHGDFSWFAAASYQTFQFPPAGLVTHDTFLSQPVYGEYPTWSRIGYPRRVVGYGGMFDSNLVNTKLKLAYDFTPTLRLSHMVGVFTEDHDIRAETLFANSGNQWYMWFGPRQSPPVPPALREGYGSFASLVGRYQNNILVNALSLRQNAGGVFDFDLSASHFYVLHNNWHTPFSQVGTFAANPIGGFTSTGLTRSDTGDSWGTVDLKGILRPFGQGGAHEISFGLYGDEAYVNGPTWLTSRWAAGPSSTVGGMYTTYAQGRTRTQALWLQEVWRIHPDLKLTVGARAEHWSATDGFNQSNTPSATGATLSSVTAPIYQPQQAHSRVSPKGVLEWRPLDGWAVLAAVGMANRFPTVSELYALSTPQGLVQPVSPNPYLRPEVSLNKELTFKHYFKSGGEMRVSLFHDDIRDFILNQPIPVAGALAPVSGNANVDLVRNTGVEIDLRKHNVLLEGLDFYATATFLNSHIIANSGFLPNRTGCALTSPLAPADCWLLSTNGKRLPATRPWRWKAGLVFSPDDRWSFSANARWADSYWVTVANNDVTCCSFAQTFNNSWRIFAVDAKVSYKWNDRFTFDFGVNNIGNYRSRDVDAKTFIASMRYNFEDGQKGGNAIFLAGDEAGMPDFSRWFRLAPLTID